MRFLLLLISICLVSCGRVTDQISSEYISQIENKADTIIKIRFTRIGTTSDNFEKEIPLNEKVTFFWTSGLDGMPLLSFDSVYLFYKDKVIIETKLYVDDSLSLLQSQNYKEVSKSTKNGFTTHTRVITIDNEFLESKLK